MSSFTYFKTPSYLNNNENISQCTMPSQALYLSTLSPENFSILSPGVRKRLQKKKIGSFKNMNSLGS